MMADEPRDLATELDRLLVNAAWLDNETATENDRVLQEAAEELRRLRTVIIEQAHAIATLQETCSAVYQAWEDGDDGMGGRWDGEDDEDDEDDDPDTDEFRPPDDGPWAPLPGQMNLPTLEDADQ